MHTTFYFLRPSDIKEDSSSVIGKPLPGIFLFVCNNHLNKLPRGVRGEIFVGGAGLAAGYLNNPELTDDRFLGESSKLGLRVYKTGDLGKWDTNGDLVYLGRSDKQIKIRGFRIETEDIIHNLLKHSSINKAAVKVWERENGQKNIVAYLQSDNADLKPKQVQDFLKDQLPKYMIPHFFVVLEAFPLTENGKVNYELLPDPLVGDTENNILDADHELTANHTLLLDVLKSVLRRDQIGINDDFFLIGGDSIVAIQVISKLYSKGFEVDVKDIFNFPVIAELSERIKPVSNASFGVDTGEVPLTPIQQRFFKLKYADPDFYNQGIVIHYKQETDPRRLKEIFAKIVEHHDAFRTGFYEGNPLPKQYVERTRENLPYKFIDRAFDGDADETLEAVIADAQQDIRIFNGSLFQLRQVRLPAGDFIIMLVHHLIIDAISWQILIGDFMTLLRDVSSGSPVNLPPKSTPYRQWALKLNEIHLSALTEEREYLDHAKLIHNSLPKGNSLTSAGTACEYAITLDPKSTELLVHSNSSFNTNVQDLLLAALSLAIADLCDVGHFAVAVESHGREVPFRDQNLSRTIGWFTTICPVFLSAAYRADLSRHIAETKESVRKGLSKGIGINVLAYTVGARAEESASILFNYLGRWEQSNSTDELQVEIYPIRHTVSEKNNTDFAVVFNSIIQNSELQISAVVNDGYFSEAEMLRLSDLLKTYILQIIDHCASKVEHEFTPSDFGYKGLSIDDLNTIFE